jgi:hypothetical protein
MRQVDPAWIRTLVRQALEEELARRQRRMSKTAAGLPGLDDPSHLEVISDGEFESDFPPRKSCLIEPHRLCFNSGYCKKLGF